MESLLLTDRVELLAHETAYQGYFQVEKVTLRHKLFAGGWTQAFTRELFERGHAAGVLLYDPIGHKVVLIEQFRVGTLGQTENPWLLELVAGIIEPDESAEQVAHRETQEEAGLSLLDLHPICEYWVSPGGTTEKVTLFCGRVDANTITAGSICGLAEEQEDIRVHIFNTKEAYKLLADGVICNAATIIALQWLQLNETKVRKKWAPKSK